MLGFMGTGLSDQPGSVAAGQQANLIALDAEGKLLVSIVDGLVVPRG